MALSIRAWTPGGHIPWHCKACVCYLAIVAASGPAAHLYSRRMGEGSPLWQQRWSRPTSPPTSPADATVAAKAGAA